MKSRGFERWQMERIEKRLMDATSSRWILDNLDNPDAFPVEVEECPKCRAIYIKALGHECKEGHEVPFRPKER
jgi:hypothetical protein